MSDSTRPDRLSRIPARTVTEADERRAMLSVAHHARDAAECRELLQALGLIEADFYWETTDSSHGTAGRRKITTGGTQ